MTDIVYGIRITGEASGAKKAFEDTSEAQKKLTGAERESTRAASQTERSFDLKSAAINRLRIALLGAGAAFAAMGKAALSAAIEAERSIARLGAIFRATGGTSGLSLAQLESVAQRLAATTRFDDDSIRDAISVLSTFRQVSGEAFGDTIKLASGLAEVMRTDLQSAVTMLGRALEDPVQGLDALRRVGVIFSGQQREVIAQLVETGRQAEAQQLILQELKSKGFDTVAAAMNQGLARASDDTRKNWNDLLEAFGRTSIVQGPVTLFLESVATKLGKVKDLIERGTFTQRLAAVLSAIPGAGIAFEPFSRVPEQVADPNAPEAVAARRAAADARFQAAFDAQQAQAREFLAKRDKEAKEAAAKAAKEFAELNATALRAEQAAFDDVRDRSVELSKLSDTRRDALEKEAQAVRDVISPWQAYAREVERLRGLLEEGVITQREFGEAVALEARKVGGAFDELADKGVQNFDELKQAVEGWGRDLSRELARGEVSILSFGRLFEELLAMQINQRAVQPFLRQGNSFIDSLLNPERGTYFDPAVSFAAPFHGGGIAGLEGGARRSVHPGHFANAPRLHFGGLAGGEVPAILRRGEGVFTPQQMRAIGGGNMTVNVINETGVPVQGQASAPRIDAEGMVVDLVLRRLAVDAGARQHLRGQLSRPEH